MNKICGFIALVFAVLFYGVSHAQMVNDGGGTPGILTTGTQEGEAVWYPHGLSGQEGTGIHFEVNDTDGRTVVLDSSEPVTLKLDSYPEMIVVHIEPASKAASTRISLSGLKPSATYYQYEDAYYNLTVISTDNEGRYAYDQDISRSHVVFIQTRKSTKYLRYDGSNDATGGDCSSIGIWDSVTKTCTLTADVYDAIQIFNQNITLDGNGHAVIGSGSGTGINMNAYPSATGITVKNVTVRNFDVGIHLGSSGSSNTISNCTVTDNFLGIMLSYTANATLANNAVITNKGFGGDGIYLFHASSNVLANNSILGNSRYGILLHGSSNNQIMNNTSSNNELGIYLFDSSQNTMIGNVLQENKYVDLYVAASSDGNCENIIENTIGSGDRPIRYYNTTVALEEENLSELVLCNADHSTVHKVTIEGSASLKNNGLFIARTDFATLSDSASLNNYFGIDLFQSGNNLLKENTLTGNQVGISLYDSKGNTVEGNTVSDGNTGLALVFSSDNNQIYNNNFINNWSQALDAGSGNLFNLAKPVGGNYWSNYDDPSEGCYDADYDGFCDAPYVFSNNRDNLPLTMQKPMDTTPPVIMATVSPAPNANGWHNSDVTVTFTCNDTESGILSCSSPVTVTTEGAGQVITGTAVDNAGNTATVSVTLNIDKSAPALDITVNPGLLWPPNHKMVTVTPIISVSDNLDTAPRIELVSVTSNEPGNGLGDGDTANDIVINGDGTISLRAERSGAGNGRVYTMTYQATDIAGNTATASATVIVPHDQGAIRRNS